MNTSSRKLLQRMSMGAGAGGGAIAGMAATANSIGWTSAIRTVVETHGTTVGTSLAVAIAAVGQLVINGEHGHWPKSELALGALAGAAITGAMLFQ